MSQPMTKMLQTLAARGRCAIIAPGLALAALALAFSGTASAQTALPPPAVFGQADTRQDRIEELESQLREATAENERMQFELIQARREVSRLQAMVGDLSAANSAIPAEPAATAAPAPAPTTPSVSPTAQQQGSLGTLPGVALPAEPGPAYSFARELLLNGRYADAEVAFAQFIEQHPSADTAPDARYWHAFTLLARSNYQGAAAGFLDYLQRYASGPRAPEALVRLGMALVGLDRDREACAAFRDLPRRYPRASQSVRDLATRESRALSCTA